MTFMDDFHGMTVMDDFHGRVDFAVYKLILHIDQLWRDRLMDRQTLVLLKLLLRLKTRTIEDYHRLSWTIMDYRYRD